MNLLDLLLLIPVVWLCIRGFSKGFILELASLIGLVLGILAAYYFSDHLKDLLKEYFTLTDRAMKVTSYILIFLAVMLVVYLIGKALEKVVEVVMLGWLNKLLGAIVGLAKGIVVVCIILFLFEKFDPAQKVIKPDVKEKSMFYGPVMEVVHIF
ncbi:MAG: CvpA family protein [Bacteroidales bacterium]|jgi:membrane protein required for colicin V production|nr:CvpA family protein [Bacteroidales bacterium]